MPHRAGSAACTFNQTGEQVGSRPVGNQQLHVDTMHFWTPAVRDPRDFPRTETRKEGRRLVTGRDCQKATTRSQDALRNVLHDGTANASTLYRRRQHDPAEAPPICPFIEQSERAHHGVVNHADRVRRFRAVEESRVVRTFVRREVGRTICIEEPETRRAVRTLVGPKLGDRPHEVASCAVT